MADNGRLSSVRKPLIIAAIAFAALGGCSAGLQQVTGTPVSPGVVNTESAAEPRSSNHLTAVVGQPIEFTVPGAGGSRAVVSVTSAKWATGPLAAYMEAPGSGNYLVIDVSVGGVKGQTHVNPLDWTAQDKDGYKYNAAIMAGVSPGLPGVDVGPGEQVRGKVAFDLAKGTAASVVMDVFLQGTLTWTMK